MTFKHKFERISRLPTYVFSEINTMKAFERSRGEDVIDFGMGNPDLATPQHIVEKLCETVKDSKTHRYSISKGILGLRKAQSKYYQRRFNVDLNPQKEVIVTLGSKEGLANLASAMSSDGDEVLVPNPSYPIHPYGFIIAGAVVSSLKSNPDEKFLSKLNEIVSSSKNKVKALILNYPNNPTTTFASLDFFGEVVKICKKYEVYILSDIAYAEIYFNTPPPSILQVKAAKGIAVEFSSLSKSYSMPGWRIGFACGNQKLIEALSKIKSYLDYGAFTPVQVAATAALNGPQDCLNDIRNAYLSRRDTILSGLKRIGWDNISIPEGTMFIWAPLPKKYIKMGSLEFSKRLLRYGKVAVSPGIGFGSDGEGYIRISLVENEHRIRQAVRNIKIFFENNE